MIMPQKLAALTIVRQDGFHDRPVTRAVVQFLQMGQFMDNNIVDEFGVVVNQTPVQSNDGL